MKSVPLADIDDTDKRFQFRFPSSRRGLRKSLASRGQLNPIKIMPGKDAYVMMDGFSRFAEAKELGWEAIRALVYPILSDQDAKKVSWECNVVRVNLSFAERANAMLMARNDGLTRGEIASLFRMSVRQVSRYLAVPEQLRALVDGKTVTMAHARELKPLIGVCDFSHVEALVVWLRAVRASVRKLRERIREDLGFQEKRGRRKRKFGCIANGDVRVRSFKVGPKTRKEDRLAAVAFLHEVIHAIERMDEQGPLQAKGTTTVRLDVQST